MNQEQEFTDLARDAAPERPISRINLWMRALMMRHEFPRFITVALALTLVAICFLVKTDWPQSWVLGCLALHAVFLIMLTRDRNELVTRIDSLSKEVVQITDQYHTLTTNLAASIIIKSGGGHIIFCSPYTEVLTGYPRGDIYERGDSFFEEIIHEDDREIYQRAQKVAAYGEAFQYRFRFFHKSGLEMWAESRTVPILDEAGAVTSSLSVLIDITGTARYQKQVEEMSQDAQDFAYMVSHDLKAPLATLKGMLTILQEEQQAPSSTSNSEALGHMERATKRLETLIQGVLDYSRVNGPTVESEPLKLRTIFRDVQKDFEPSLKSALAYFEAHDGGLAIVGDPLRAYQIFSNLVSNALKYRDPVKPQRIAIRASHAPGSRWVQVTVSDTGLGIPADKLHAIFRPFVRIHTQGTEGAGVGLACVKKMIEKLGGEVSVTSTLGLGTEFTLKFVKAVDSN